MKGASTANKANIDVYSSNSSNAQRFYLRSKGSGYYTIQNTLSGKYVDANDGKTEYDRDSVYVRLTAKYALTENFGIGAFYTYEDIDSEIASSYKENVFGVNATVTLF